MPFLLNITSQGVAITFVFYDFKSLSLMNRSSTQYDSS
jgi:hypothetical protein